MHSTLITLCKCSCSHLVCVASFDIFDFILSFLLFVFIVETSTMKEFFLRQIKMNERDYFALFSFNFSSCTHFICVIFRLIYALSVVSALLISLSRKMRFMSTPTYRGAKTLCSHLNSVPKKEDVMRYTHAIIGEFRLLLLLFFMGFLSSDNNFSLPKSKTRQLSDEYELMCTFTSDIGMSHSFN